MNTKQKGFTLIELLVVIAIIGILSAIILASLSSARNQGINAAIESQLAAMQPEGEIDYNTYGDSYLPSGTTVNTSCTAGVSMFQADSNFISAIKDLDSNANGGSAGVYCYNSATNWSITVKLVSPVAQTATTGYWCVDNSGNSEATGTTGTMQAMPEC